MSKIKILPENLANQIAAGEVVERPSSVIKELIENSIDAGAKRVKVEIELGGRRLMRVSDDGHGMAKNDALLAFERHATSKISELKDLGNIETLGFRGEALASIASVAKVELNTNVSDSSVATNVIIEGGKLVSTRETARPTGTTVTVRELFYNTPARRKFMRSHATENYHVTNTVTHYALANPEIAFSLTNNGRETIRLAPATNLKERAFQLFGAEIIESLLPVRGGREFVAAIEGFVSAPRERRTTRDSQYFFINGRYVKDKIIAGGLLEGFRSVLPQGAYPVAFLFVTIPVDEIDVNVHPAKTEVRFRRSRAVKDVIAGAVRESLMAAGIVAEQKQRLPVDEDSKITGRPDSVLVNRRGVDSSWERRAAQEESEIDVEVPAPSSDFNKATLSSSLEQSGRHQDRSGKRAAGKTSDEQSITQSHPGNTGSAVKLAAERPTGVTADYVGLPPVDSALAIPNSVDLEDISPGKIRAVGQLHESFIIAVDDQGLLLIDQHVAHERILFDRFKKNEIERTIESQNLLVPETVDLTPAQLEVFAEIKDQLAGYGFRMMTLSGRTVAITSVPTDLPAAEARNLFSEILDTVEREKRGHAKRLLQDDIAAAMACKAAVKINTKLSPEKMTWMIDNLLLTSSPSTCPHGRPIVLRLTMKDIERKFQRN